MRLHALTNENGVEVAVTDYGATLVSVKVPDREGRLADVVLGYDAPEEYVSDKAFLGGTIGRYANRISRSRFKLDGVGHTLTQNQGEHHLHGGLNGFHKAVWQATALGEGCICALQLDHLSKDGEEGYPGNLRVRVIYTLTDKNELRIEYEASTDRTTILNLTNHSYFNLARHKAGDILNHELTLRANHYTPIDANLLPTGEIRGVENTPFDFRRATRIGEQIDNGDEQLCFAQGYDHNWVLNDGYRGDLTPAAEVYEPSTGRVLEVFTTEPGIQFYSGNFLDGTIHGKGNHVYNRRAGFCLETQHFPDSPNHPEFPSAVLREGDRYQSMTAYKFSFR